jgi:predicted NBD/HSP70 family sugar kinase
MQGHNATTIRRLNRGMVLRLLNQQPHSRRQLARATRLRASTISLIVAELLAAGLVHEQPRPAARTPRPGRQEVPLALAPDGAYAIGVHIGIFGSQVALINARAEIIARRTELLPSPPTPAAVVAQLQRLTNDLIAETAIDPARLLGIGVGVLAYVEPERGLVRYADHLGWRDVPLAAQLAAATGLPVAIEHNVRSMALAEQLFGQQRDRGTFAFLNVGTGIGAALVVNGQLVEGHAHAAGQLGHLPVVPDGPLCSCGRHGCLDTIASMQAVRARAVALAGAHPNSTLAARIGEATGRYPESLVLELAAAGDSLAQTALTAGAEPLARALAMLLALIDPELIVVSAGASAYDHVLIPPLRAALAAVAALPTAIPPLVPSTFGRAQAVIGGAAVALQRLFDEPDHLIVEPPALDGAPVGVT